MKYLKEFTVEDMKEFEPIEKVGLIGTINEKGLPHITLITTIQAKTPGNIMWGQFIEGESKASIRKNPRAAFLIMTPKKNLWRGKAKWTNEEKSGEDYEMFNKKPMFRYNSYFGIHTVHYMDIIEVSEKENLPVKNIILSTIKTLIAKGGAKTDEKENILNLWTITFFNKLGTLKFLSYVEKDEFPTIIPLIQCQAQGSRRLVFATFPYTEELNKISKDTSVAVFGLNLNMESVLVRGIFLGCKRVRGVNLGIIDINWVYNSMPPKQGQIYPRVNLESIQKTFDKY